MLPECKPLPIGALHAHPNNPRTVTLNPELTESLRGNGLISPLVVRPWKDGWQVLSGHCRLASLRELGQNVVRCEIKHVDDKTASFILLESNIQQKTLEPIEEARALKQRIEQFSLTQAEVAKEFGRSQQWVSGRIALLPVAEKPKREDGRGRPAAAVDPVVFTPRVVNAPKVAEQVRSAPAAAQPAVAKSAEDAGLSKRQTAALVEAIKSAPPERQAEVAAVAAQTDNPVETARTAARQARLEPEKPVTAPPPVDPVEGSMVENFMKLVSGFNDKFLKIRLFSVDNSVDRNNWKAFHLNPDTEYLRLWHRILCGVITHLEEARAALEAEMLSRQQRTPLRLVQKETA